MTLKDVFSTMTDEKRHARLREQYDDFHTCPECGEPIGGMWHWKETLRNEDEGVVVGYEDCPYCQIPLWLTVDNEVVVDRRHSEVAA